jgi:hypothetical protein
MIEPGQEFVELCPYRANRTLRVKAVALPEDGVSKAVAFCLTRGKGTVISFERLLNRSRFIPRNEYAEVLR